MAQCLPTAGVLSKKFTVICWLFSCPFLLTYDPARAANFPRCPYRLLEKLILRPRVTQERGIVLNVSHIIVGSLTFPVFAFPSIIAPCRLCSSFFSLARSGLAYFVNLTIIIIRWCRCGLHFPPFFFLIVLDCFSSSLENYAGLGCFFLLACDLLFIYRTGIFGSYLHSRGNLTISHYTSTLF